MDPMNPDPKPKHPGGRPFLPEGERATFHIHLRTTRERKNAYVNAARPDKLTAWAFKHLDKAAREAGQEPEPIEPKGEK